MALDIHIGNHINNSEYKCFLSELVHDTIFEKNAAISSKFPQLSKIRDYYSDTNFSSEEIPILLMQLQEIRKILCLDEQLDKEISNFIITCQNAVDESLNIYCFCD